MRTQQIDLSNKATYELEHMVKALKSMSLLNTPEENKRLESAQKELSKRRKQQRYK